MVDAQITVLVVTSPIKSHPSTHIIEETLRSIRFQLPDSPIIVCFDGLRPEDLSKTEAYTKYKWDLISKIDNKEFGNVMPVVFENHMHQSGMTREVLAMIATPLLLFVEHDTPLVDHKLPFDKFAKLLLSDKANVIRLYHEKVLQPEHRALMGNRKQINGLGFRKSTQWSQRPHLSTVEYYKHMIRNYFKPEARGMIEDLMHSYVMNEPWFKHRVLLYDNGGDNIEGSYHLDGRDGEPKHIGDYA